MKIITVVNMTLNLNNATQEQVKYALACVHDSGFKNTAYVGNGEICRLDKSHFAVLSDGSNKIGILSELKLKSILFSKAAELCFARLKKPNIFGDYCEIPVDNFVQAVPYSDLDDVLRDLQSRLNIINSIKTPDEGLYMNVWFSEKCSASCAILICYDRAYICNVEESPKCVTIDEVKPVIMLAIAAIKLFRSRHERASSA